MTPLVSTYFGWRKTLAALALASSLTGFAARGEPPTAYRRIFVPADNPAAWPRGDDTFLPVEDHDFDAWIAIANEPPPTASIVEANYEARLVENELADGRGRWHVVLRDERPARLTLGDSPLILYDAQWRGESVAPARLGWWPAGDGGPLCHALEVPRSGDLEFSWRATSTSKAAATLEFLLHLPVAARTRLILDLPAGRRPVVRGGVVLQTPARPEEGGHWVLAVDASAADVLRIENTNRAAAPPSFASSVRESLRYEVGNRGIELEAKLRLAATGAAIQELSVSLPAGLQLISAAIGEQDLKWQVMAENVGSAPRAVIQLPTSLPVGPTTVTLRAWRPLVLGKPVRLQMLTLDDAFWTSGTIEIALTEMLELRDLTPIDCVQSRVASSDGPPHNRGRSLQFAAFSPSATVGISVGHQPERGRVRMGTALEVGNPGVVGRLVADVSVGRGSLHKLTAELQPGWSIDAVETVPANALGEWYINRARGERTVELQLNRAVTTDQPVTIVVTGRLARAAAREPLPLANLRPLAWRGLSVERNLLQLQAAEQLELETVGELSSVVADTLTAAERQLFATPDDGRICDFAASSPHAAIRLAPNKGTFDAAIQLDATLIQGRLQQTYRIDCSPHGSGIDHVLVYLSAPASEPLRWKDAQSHEPLSAEQVPASDSRLRGLPPGGELWQLNLRRLYARPLAITANCSLAWAQRQTVPLVSLPDAATQQGRVTVSSAAAEIPTIVARGMSPAPIPFETPDNTSSGFSVTPRAVYRFQPTRFYDAGPAPELWLGPAVAANEGAQLLATHIDVESRFAANGLGVHRITYHLENQGANTVELTLPEGVRLEAARVDGQPVANLRPEKIAVPLSSRTSNAVLEMELTSRQPPLANGCRLQSPLPTDPLTILDGRWTVLLPHGFAAIGDAAVPTAGAFNWRERLFGPLARSRSVHPFNPFAAEDWNRLWAGISDAATTAAQASAIEKQDGPPLPTGWHAYRVGFVAAAPGALTVANLPTTTAGALAIFLACAVGAALGGMRVFSMVLLAIVAAMVSLLLPIVYVPFATAAALGLLTAALWQWLPRLIGVSQPAVMAVAAAIILSSPGAHAAPPPVAVERVFVPVDSDGKTVGSKYFVSPSFLRRLIKLSSGQSPNGVWLLTDMRCDGEVVPRQDQTGIHADNWSLTLEVDVFTRDTTVSLPLVQGEAEWAAAASLDGMPAPLKWDASGQGCSVRVAEPGHRRLSISLEPHVEEVAGWQQLALSLPPITGAAVRIVSPPGLADLRGNGADLSRHDEPSRTVWEGKLDSSGRFTVSWPAILTGTTAETNRRVDELLWLHVRPDGLTLDARFTLPSGVDWPNLIDVAVDGGWELLAEDVARLGDNAETLPDGRRLLHVRKPPATDEHRQVSLRFRARDASPLGRLRFPAIDAISLQIENRWFAVSCDPGLECLPSAPATTSPPVDFVTAWGTAVELAPQIFVNADDLDAAWYLAVRPRVGLSSCQDRLSLAVGKGGMRVDYRSDVTPKGADLFGWSLAVPATLAVDRVAVASDGKRISLDWVRAAPNRLNLFFAERVTRSYQVLLRGRLPVTPDGRVTLPRITAAGPQQATQTVALYRDEDVLARWHFSGETPWVESAASPSPPFGQESHFVQAYSVDSLADDAVQILVEPNRLVVGGNTLTRVSRNEGSWVATFACDLHVERGELDVLRLEIPANWNGPFEVTPAATTQLTALGSRGEQAKLSILLPQPAGRGDTVKLQVRSPLALAEAELPAVPQVVLLAPGQRRNFLSLPASLDGQRVAWTHGGVEPAELPRNLRLASFNTNGAETFRLVADTINVTLRPRPNHTSSARVRLAETAVHVGPVGGMFAVTRFIVAPEGLGQCIIAISEGERLVRVKLDGHPALVRSINPSRWQVQLGPPNLPQTLDVVSRSVDRSDPSSRPVEMSRPVLEQSGRAIPVELGLWTLCGTVPEATPRVSGSALVSPTALAAARLERLTSISHSATRSLIESPVVDGISWFAQWAAGLDAAGQVAGSLRRSSAEAGEAIRVPQPADDSVSEIIAQSDDWIEQVGEIFADSGLAIPRPERPAALDLWRNVAPDSPDRVCLISPGDQHRVVVEWKPDEMTATETRYVACVSLAALALVAVWLVRTPPALRFLEGWPAVVAVVAGLAAWAWLRISGVGLLVAAVGLGLLLRRLYRARISPGHDSSNQPSSNPEEVAH